VRTALAAGIGPVTLWCSPDTAHPAFAACAAVGRPAKAVTAEALARSASAAATSGATAKRPSSAVASGASSFSSASAVAAWSSGQELDVAGYAEWDDGR
jgi:hypothetical protein